MNKPMNEVHAQFEPGTERPVSDTPLRFRHTLVVEFDPAPEYRTYAANADVMGGRLVRVAFNDSLEELRRTETDLASAQDDLRESREAIAALSRKLGMAMEQIADAKRALGL